MRKRFKIPLLSLAFLILVIAGSVIWVLRSGWLQRRVMAYVNQALAVKTTLAVDIGELGGNPFSGVVADDIVIRTTGRLPDTLATIKHFSVQYSISDLWKRHWIVENMLIDSLRIYLPGDSIAKAIRSLVRAAETDKSSHPTLFDFRLNSLILNGGTILRDHDPIPLADSIHLQLSAYRAGERLDARVDQIRASLPDIGPILISGLLTSVGDAWTVDSASVATTRSNVSGSGGPTGWIVQTNPIDLADINPYINGRLTGQLDYHGSIRLPDSKSGATAIGTVSGTFEGYNLDDVMLRLTMSGSRFTIDTLDGAINGINWHGAAKVDLGPSPPKFEYTGTVEHFDLNKFAPETLPSDLSGTVRMTGEGLSNATLAMDLTVALHAGHINHFSFDTAAGLLHVTPRNAVIAQDFYMARGASRVIGGGGITYSDSLDLLLNVWCDDLRPWDSLVFVDSLAGRTEGYIYLSGLTADPDVAGRLTSDSLRLFDLRTRQLTASFFVPHFKSHPTGTVQARFGNSNAWGWEVDSIMVKAALEGHMITFDSLAWNSAQAVINGRGRLDWSADTIPIWLYPVTAHIQDQTLSAIDTVAVVADSLGFNFSNLSVKSEWGTLQAYGHINYDQTLNMVLEVEGVPVADIWKRFYPKFDLEGQLACLGRVRGSMAAPKFDLDGHITGLSYQGDRLGDLAGSLSYEDGQLSTDQLELTHSAYRVQVAGSLPMELRFDKPAAHILDQPLSGRLTATGSSLDIVSRYLPETIESVRGQFSISAILSGTPRVPLIRGEAFLRGATIKAVEIANPIEDVQVDLSLRQDTIEVTRGVATMRDKNRRGQIQITGYIRLLAYNLFDYNLKLTGRNVPARFEFQDFYVETDCDLTVTGINPPTVRGHFAPKRIEDREPFSGEQMEAVSDTSLWNWDMTVDVPGNYWLHNDQIDAELSADLRVMRDRGRPVYLGTAEFIRGKVYLYDKVGTITRGVLTFDNPNVPDPTLDIAVTFRINQPRLEQASAGRGRDVIDLNLTVSGKASEPLIQPQPPYNQQDVVSLMVANTTYGSGDTTTARDPWADRLRFAATNVLFSEVQRLAARKLGIEIVEISSSADPKMTQVLVGHSFSPHLYLYGSSPLDVGAGQEVGFEYRFSRHIYLDGSRDKDNLYRLNVHFNWDY